MISPVNNQGKCYWTIVDGVFNADRLIEFMESLAKDAPRKVFLVMDNLKVHRCKPVKEWLEKNKERTRCSICRATARSRTRTNG